MDLYASNHMTFQYKGSLLGKYLKNSILSWNLLLDKFVSQLVGLFWAADEQNDKHKHID